MTVAVLALVAVAVAWPMLGVALSVRAGTSADVDFSLLVRSVAVASLISFLSLVLAWPAAWIFRRGGRASTTLLMAPMLFPSYLAYTGWGVLRAPDSAIGKWLMMGPARTGPGDTANWYPVAAGYTLAVLGLALWSWPLAAVIVGVRFRRIDDSVLELLKIESSSRWSQWRTTLSMCRASLAIAAALLVLIMLGSAIPLHLAQLDTYAIHIWRLLDQTARADQWKVWISAWPLIAIAAGASAVITIKVRGVESEDAPRRALRSPAWPLTGGIWTLSIIVPVALLAFNIRSWHTAPVFFRLIQGPFFTSLTVAACIGGATAVLAMWTWVTLSGAARKTGTAVGAILLAAGLIPGVLIGSATVQAWASVSAAGSWVADSLLIVIFSHLARFGFIGIVTGWWLASTEPRALRDLRTMDSGQSFRGWWLTAIAPGAPAILAASTGAAFLSFHEIESTVLVQPPSSSGGSFAWQMLQWLHFARMDELGMGVLLVVGMGLAAALAVIAAQGRSRR